MKRGPFRLEILNDRLDDEIATCELVELRRAREAAQRRIALVWAELVAFDAIGQESLDSRQATGHAFLIYLADNRAVASLSRDLGDAGPHEPAPQYADRRERRG